MHVWASANPKRCRRRSTVGAGALFICAQSVIGLVVCYLTRRRRRRRQCHRWTDQPASSGRLIRGRKRRWIFVGEKYDYVVRLTAAAARFFSSIIGACNLVSVRARTASDTHVPALIVASSLHPYRPVGRTSRTFCLPHMMHRAVAPTVVLVKLVYTVRGLWAGVERRRADKFTTKCCG